jgi:hypothetical protein
MSSNPNMGATVGRITRTAAGAAADIRVGDWVRSFDFDCHDLAGERASYVEGQVLAIVNWQGCDRYEILPTLSVRRGQRQRYTDPDPNTDYVMPPVNGTPTIFDGVTGGVVRIPAPAGHRIDLDEPEPAPEPEQEPDPKSEPYETATGQRLFDVYDVFQVHGLKRVAYKLIGPRGHVFALWRSDQQPAALFVMNSRCRIARLRGYLWFTDMRGFLEPLNTRTAPMAAQ